MIRSKPVKVVEVRLGTKTAVDARNLAYRRIPNIIGYDQGERDGARFPSTVVQALLLMQKSCVTEIIAAL